MLYVFYGLIKAELLFKLIAIKKINFSMKLLLFISHILIFNFLLFLTIILF